MLLEAIHLVLRKCNPNLDSSYRKHAGLNPGPFRSQLRALTILPELLDHVHIIISLCVVFFIKTVLSYAKNKNLPPGPRALPFIGHLHLIKTPLHHCLARISQNYGPATFLRLGSHPVLVISSKPLAEQCFTIHDLAFADRMQLPSSKHFTFNYTVFGDANYGAYWRNVRQISAVELLSAQRLHASSNVRAGEVQNMARQLFKSWETCIGSKKGSNGLKKLELKTSLFQLSLNVLMIMMAGKRFYRDDIEGLEEIKRFREVVEKLFALMEISNIEDFIPALSLLDMRGVMKKTATLAEENKDMIKKLIEEHRSNSNGQKKNTMIAHLLEMQKKDPEAYKDETIQAIIMTLLLAGTETSANVVEWAMSCLVNNPDILKKAATEIDKIIGKERLVEESDLPNLPYIHCIMSEVLRLYPGGALLIPHKSRKDVTIGGYNIPRGTMLLVNAYYIHRDTDTWDEPMKFKPERFENGKAEGKWMIPFGMGRRRCPGEGLAMRQMGVVLATLIQCFEWERPGDELVDMSETSGITLAKAIPLEVMYRPRESVLKLLSAL
ncbi:hypothetical protein LUZ61_000215 [Rhynchospora tenuis]|uniref:Uncharacterized protein n=1 Tax=Rhynchospora tenuis TaxID=198213 RepID=A0AAD5ZEV2_9POAL|nr:hypothetical protein LUZ61_000215 [Rhynchospora tenuis]